MTLPEDTFGHRFSDPSLLEQALTHRSVESPGRQDYERLEFLGDRVLALVVTVLALRPDELRELLLAERMARLLAAALLETRVASRVRGELAEIGTRELPAVLGTDG